MEKIDYSILIIDILVSNNNFDNNIYIVTTRSRSNIDIIKTNNIKKNHSHI